MSQNTSRDIINLGMFSSLDVWLYASSEFSSNVIFWRSVNSSGLNSIASMYVTAANL